jgi:hypothetical protein
MQECQPSRRRGAAAMLSRVLLPTIILCFTLASTQAQTSQADNKDNAWETSSEFHGDNLNSTRTTTRHNQSGNRTVDEQSVQIRGLNGDFELYQDTEKETLELDANTTRTITRTFARDANRAKSLVQITEEETHKLPSGESDVTRAISNTDVNGNVQVVRRETEATRKVGADVEESRTTVMLPNVNGGFSPVRKVEERRQHTDKDTIQTKTTTLVPDGAGNWHVDEVREITSKQEGKVSSTVERVSRPDVEGKLGEISRIVSTESERGSGEKRRSIETYSLDTLGYTRDGNLHLVKRATTEQRSNNAGAETVEEVLEQLNPGDPSHGLRVTTMTSNVLRSGSSGAENTRTVEVRDINGNVNVISVDMTKSDNGHAIQVQIAPPKQQ